MLSGKWYFEGRKSATSGGDFVAFENHINDSVGWGSDQLGFSYRADGQKQNNTSGQVMVVLMLLVILLVCI